MPGAAEPNDDPATRAMAALELDLTGTGSCSGRRMRGSRRHHATAPTAPCLATALEQLLQRLNRMDLDLLPVAPSLVGYPTPHSLGQPPVRN